MRIHIEERRAWMRTTSHTIVFDRDEDFDEISSQGEGQPLRILRVWLTDAQGDPPKMRGYLGTLRLFDGEPSEEDLDGLHQRAAELAPLARKRPAALKRDVTEALREFLHRDEAGEGRLSD